jgi:hypothetical protein
MPRDNFSTPVKRELALRAAHFCSNPYCLKLTAGPRGGTARGLGTGHAAHICGASANGPRFDPGQSEAERRAIENGIWLCRECGEIVDRDEDSHSADTLRAWKRNHEAMIAEVRLQGYSRSLELLRSNQAQPGLARQIVALFEDRRMFWARFDAEFPDRVRISLENLRHDLTHLRTTCAAGSAIDAVLVALGRTVRHFFDAVERLDLTALRCDSYDPDWREFESALRALRKSIGYQIAALADAYQIPLSGEFAEQVPHYDGNDAGRDEPGDRQGLGDARAQH